MLTWNYLDLLWKLHDIIYRMLNELIQSGLSDSSWEVRQHAEYLDLKVLNEFGLFTL